jgi:SAM-dependent methyltransferase
MDVKPPNLQHLLPAYWQGWLDAWTYLQAVHAGSVTGPSVEAVLTPAAASDYWAAVYQNLADYDAVLDGAPRGGFWLNLGSGEMALHGFVNVDLIESTQVLVVDLRQRWPWEDGSVDYVRASHILEHLPDKIFTMNELWRVLKREGRVRISIPTTDGPGAWQDPTHVSFWNRRSCLYFENGSAYRTAYGTSYGIEATFKVLRERVDLTPDGPILEITLVAEKPEPAP